jgi:L-rhamnonate dehydratase
MRITAIEPIVLRLGEVDVSRADGTQDALLVRIHTDEGLIGLGEADSSPYLVRTAIEMPSSHAVAQGISELLVGANPLDIDRIWQLLYRGTSYYGRSAVALHAISAIDLALWDLAGKVLNLSVAELLGGRTVERVPVYASEVMPETPDEVRRLAEGAVQSGYGAFKLGWGPLGQDPGLDVALIEAARQALGPSPKLMIDGGQVYTAKSARSLLRRVEGADLFWFEEPFAPEDLASYRELSWATEVAVAAGEADAGAAAFAALIDEARIDVLQPDLSRCGGFTVARQIRDMCRPSGPLIVPHCFSTGVLVAACLQFVASLDRPLLSEYSIAGSPLVNELLAEPFVLSDGSLAVPTGPGLGVDLDEQVLTRLRVE